MKVGLIGFAGAGKSTLYRAAARGQAKGTVTAVPVPDPRFDAIVEQVKPKKITPATVILDDDLESIHGGSTKLFSQRFLDSARQADLLLHVVRAFESDMVAYHETVDPLRDQQLVDEEMILSDLQIVENRLERLTKSMNVKSPGHPDYLEKQLFEKVRPVLEDGRPLRAIDLDEDQLTITRNYQFLTAKPTVVAFNVGEGEAAQPSERLQSRIGDLADHGAQAFAVCAEIEEEVAQLDPADQPEFLASLGIEEPAANKVIRAVYDALGLITFFTAGENETRAWALRRGSSALKAAGTIHTDIAKGFIRAEIVHYADYAEAGSLHNAYHSGKMHLEGKEYVVQDGDLIHIRNKS
ncbi:MAG TPA: DUF933 domain-containing protein [Fimbriimonadaceae bacterium]|nr:DUF933 domain-containing protein [Fimbriimonadaceae bacterium]